MKITLRSIFIVAIVLLLSVNSLYSANEWYRSNASSSWHLPGTWQWSLNSGSTWGPALFPPNENSGPITIQSGHNVTVVNSTNADQLTVNSGGTITISSPLTIVDGTGTDMIVQGGGFVNSGNVISSSGNVTMNISGNATFNSNIIVNGALTISDAASPFSARIRGNVTVSNTGVLFHPAASELRIYGTLTNNGTITSAASAVLKLYGSSFVNNSAVNSSSLFFDSTTSLSGSGSFTGANISIGSTGNVTLQSNVIFTITKFRILTNGNFSMNGKELQFNADNVTTDTIEVLSAGTSGSNGTIKTQGLVLIIPRTNSNFNSALTIVSGTTTVAEFVSPFNARLGGNVTVSSGAVLATPLTTSFTISIYGSLSNNGTISGSSTNNTVKCYGTSISNQGSVQNISFTLVSDDTNVSGSGSGSFTNSNVRIDSTTNINDYQSFSGGKLSIAGNMNIDDSILVSNSTIERLVTGTAGGAGFIKTQNTVTIDPGLFFVKLKINSGTTSVKRPSPGACNYFGEITIANGAILSSGTPGYILELRCSIINNGSISGTGKVQYGIGSVNLSGTGQWLTKAFFQSGSNVTLQSDQQMKDIEINTGGTFNLNGYTLKLKESNPITLGGTLNTTNSTIEYNGSFAQSISTNVQYYNIRLNNSSGTSLPGDLSFTGLLSVLAGTFNMNSQSAHAFSNAGILNNTSMTNGSTIECYSGNHTIQGTGSIQAEAIVRSSGVVTLTSNHSLRKVTIQPGGTFNLNGKRLSLTSSNPIDNAGVFLTANGAVEYNGTNFQLISCSNITYEVLRINNPAGTRLTGNVLVNDSINLISGGLDLSGFVLTLSPVAYLRETESNLIKDSLANLGTGYIITTKNIYFPSYDNISGLGIHLFMDEDLGSTIIRRGHTIQGGLPGGTGISRYYDIIPSNDVSTKFAELGFVYGNSELNGLSANSLKLFSSSNFGTSWKYRGGTVFTGTRTITFAGSFGASRWTADTSSALPNVFFTVIPQGFYNASKRLNMKDTVRAYLRDDNPPYFVVDSAISVIDSVTFTGMFVFPGAQQGNYYIQIQHRNSIETWSKSIEVYNPEYKFNYDFTLSANRAFGDNMAQVDTSPLRFGIYSGDVDQEGNVDLSDIVITFNDANNFSSGYINSDVNGDNLVDLTDVIIVFNNANAFVTVVKP